VNVFIHHRFALHYAWDFVLAVSGKSEEETAEEGASKDQEVFICRRNHFGNPSDFNRLAI
jgi:hypothetical protein